VSKHDDHFFNVFSVVIGILVAITIGIFVLARITGYEYQGQYAGKVGLSAEQVAERIAPVGQVAVAGQDNSALAIQPDDPSKAVAAQPLPADGAATYAAVCSACHGAGIAGAPKAGDKAAWAPRLAQGKTALYKHAIEGYQGGKGVMPARGGRTDLTDDLVKQAVDHLIAM
jgi:cytochrome c5